MGNGHGEPIFKNKPLFQEWINRVFYGETPQTQASERTKYQQMLTTRKLTSPPTKKYITVRASYTPKQRTRGLDAFILRAGN
jgi:hypothetical protein